MPIIKKRKEERVIQTLIGVELGKNVGKEECCERGQKSCNHSD